MHFYEHTHLEGDLYDYIEYLCAIFGSDVYTTCIFLGMNIFVAWRRGETTQKRSPHHKQLGFTKKNSE